MEPLPARTLSVSIDAPPSLVYGFLSDPENLPRWSFFSSITKTDEGWRAEAPQGTVGLRFAPPNELGVVDHFVQPPGRGEIPIPMRVIANGTGSEVLFTLFQILSMPDEAYAEEVEVVERDLARLKDVLEGQQPD
ncbi:MAG: hypothetical protein R3320_03020 [Nitriliruptorales bacterium]|nr:hypothetical protein [Nitriliruptorales bacterium]